MRCRLLLVATLFALSVAGCAHPQAWPMFPPCEATTCAQFADEWASPERLDQGLAIVLPGIESDSFLNRGLAEGLISGGFPGAVEVDDWTTGKFRSFRKHLVDIERNLREASRIADKIVGYQDRYPGRPVYVLGFSGGGGVAVLVVESLPAERTIAGAVLIEAAISPCHDLTYALSRTDRGIWNFSSKWDAFLLKLGTSVAGTIDREYTVSAGAVGFQLPANLDEAGKRLYAEKLHEVPYSAKTMRENGHFGGHFGPVKRRFSEVWIAPLLMPAP